MSPPNARRRPKGLFWRILLTFVGSVLGFASLVAVVTLVYADAYGPDWVAKTLERAARESTELELHLDDPAQLQRKTEVLTERLDTRIAVRDRRGRLIAGRGPPRLRIPHRHRRALRADRPAVVRTGRFSPPILLLGLTDPGTGRTAALLSLQAQPRGQMRRRLLVAGAAGLLLVLGVGAWLLARSLTRRLSTLERSANRIAGGDLRHRVELRPHVVRDEIDELGAAFNEMASRLDDVLRGQRTLLANVSHELRTPVSRMKVLLEILDERLERLMRELPEHDDPHATSARIRTGLRELSADLDEVETLIADLLTSGRLELRAGSGRTIQREHIDLRALLEPLAARSGARVECPGAHRVLGDSLMLERLASNLLTNARRACPDGEVVMRCEDPGQDQVILAVEDEGPGILPADREQIFEPFSRLDAARARDRGGVGLGLYLCRQIARAHGGSIRVEDRAAGKRGARIAVTLPRAPAATTEAQAHV